MGPASAGRSSSHGAAPRPTEVGPTGAAHFGAVLVAAILAFAPLVAKASPPSFADVKAGYVSSEALLLDRHGAPLSELRVNAKVRQLEWVALADVSPAMTAALVAAEDKRFWEHDGVDWTGMAVAAWDSVWRIVDGRRPRGGSTLTMQLAGHLEPALRPKGGDVRTFAQKWDQAEAAVAIERAWTKREILEAYLNLSSYRGELRGLRAAAQGLFAKAPDGLDAREAAILVALLRGPGAKPALVAQRACAVANDVNAGADCDAIRATASMALAGAYRMPPRWNLAPHLAVKLLKSPGARVTTTLDAELQAYAVATLADHLAELAGRGVQDGAIVVLDNATGDVLAWVGSSGETSDAAQVDGVVAPRQAGSTLKPFLYALALDRKLVTAASLVDDSPLAIATERGVYAPQNYDRGFHGAVSVRTALASSLNVPAVRTLDLVGLDRFHDTLRELGFDTLTQPDDYYGASLALGGADVTLLALTNAYRALANGGVRSRTRTVAAGTGAPMRLPIGPDPAESRRVLGARRELRRRRHPRRPRRARDDVRARESARDPRLERREDRHEQGHARQLVRRLHVALHGRRVGRQLLGGADARRVRRHRRRADLARPRAPAAPRRAVASSVAARGRRARQPSRSIPRSSASAASGSFAAPRSRRSAPRRGLAEEDGDDAVASIPRIRYPAPDTIVALDPDIPPASQRMAFVASAMPQGLRWTLNGAEIAGRGARVLWAPVPGRHVLALEDANGVAVSTATFEVRGPHRGN